MRLSLVAFILAASLCASAAHAQPQPLANCGGNWTSWPASNPETIWQLSTSAMSNDLSNPDLAAMLNEGFEEWARPGCTSFEAAQGPDTAASPMNTDDDIHTIGFVNNGWVFGPGTLAVTQPSFFNNCDMAKSDMVFNGQDYEWVNGAPGAWWEIDFEAVAVHEIGHWIGFDHNGWPGSSLDATYSGGTDERTLTCSDTEGVCFSYASSSDSCTDDRYCACDSGCFGDVCGGGDDDDDDDDDDDGAPEGICGSGVLQAVSEQEPNDWLGEEDVNFFEASGADLIFSGSLTCGNDSESYTGDLDWVVIDFPCDGEARFELDWSSNSLMDFYVWNASEPEPFAEVQSEQVAPPTSQDAQAGGRLFVAIACWDGDGGLYDFSIDWAPFGQSGDDDDATQPADDDDAGDDDDDGTDDGTDGGGQVGSVRSNNACGCDALPSAPPGMLVLLAAGALALTGARRRL